MANLAPARTTLGYTNGGRSTVLVTAVGQESFVDRNSNGIMDPDEKNLFTNLPEAFLDNNEDKAYTPYLCDPANGPVPSVAQCRAGSEESYLDFNSNGSYDLNNDPAVYNGLACPTSGNGVYCSRDLVNVRADEVLILSAPDLDVGQNLGYYSCQWQDGGTTEPKKESRIRPISLIYTMAGLLQGQL